MSERKVPSGVNSERPLFQSRDTTGRRFVKSLNGYE